MSARESWTKRRAQHEEAMPGTALAPTGPMNAVHRCDRCGAQAYVRPVGGGLPAAQVHRGSGPYAEPPDRYIEPSARSTEPPA